MPAKMAKGKGVMTARHFLLYFTFMGVVAGVTAGAARGPGQAIAPTSAATDGFQTHVRPVLEEFCFRCHGETKHKAGLSFSHFATAQQARAEHEVWSKVLRVLQEHEMPPEGKPQPSPGQRDQIIGWVHAEMFPLDCDHPDPGRVTIRRLNRAEYNNTIRDLVGVTFHPADDFPPDDSGYGFDNIGDVLSLSPILLEKYLAAAERILDAAIVTPESIKPPEQIFAANAFKATGGGGLSGTCCFQLFSQGEVYVQFAPRSSGEFRLRVRAYGQQAGPDSVRMTVKADGKELKTFEVKAVEETPGDYEVRCQLAAGNRRLAAGFINDYYNPNDPNRANRDRNLVVQSITVEGPLDAPPPSLPETHRRIFICEPTPGNEPACARKIIRHFARRAFRRPVADEEVARLAKLADSARRDGESFEQSIKLALEAVLVSPHFLFRGELQPEPNNPETVRPIDEFALASRLSYFLWSSLPDDELFRLAQDKQLRAHLEPQVRRMLKDQRAQALVQNFGEQWLQTRNLDLVSPDAHIFPGFNETLRRSMRRETDLLFATIIREDRSVLDFLTADFTYVNGPLARLYGIDGVKGDKFQRVSLKGTGRGGLLTHASVLTITSNPTRTSPVKRGKWVLENLLNAPPPPPPPNVPALNESQEAAANTTLRQRMEQHRANPLCASCHARMDPIGFGLENFDGIGAWRQKDGGLPIDPAGQLNTGETFAGAADLRHLLATAKRDQFVRCVAEKLLTYALGRGLEYYDRCAVDRMVQNVAKQDYRFSSFILEITRSAPFQMRRGEGERLAQVDR